MLMLALVLFPIAEKAQHELAHLNEIHCGIADLHFCETEHTCDICDYVFSSSATPPAVQECSVAFTATEKLTSSELVFNTKTAQKYNLSLRGPPATS